MANPSWCDLFLQARVDHMARFKSDHTPLLLKVTGEQRRSRGRRRRRHFETAWLLDPDCEGIVKEAWGPRGCETVEEKIGNVARGLEGWSRGKFTNFGKQIAELEEKLKRVQMGASGTDSETNTALQRVLDDLLEKQEAYWYMRSRVAELRDWDKNTKYFHHKASQRKKRNSIAGLFDSEGVWRSEDTEIEHIICDYYHTLFTTSHPSQTSMEDVLSAVSPAISEEMNADLLRPCTKDEVWNALNQMHPCKAPGPDGMHAIFYQKFWHIVGEDVAEAVIGIFHGTRPPDSVNSTLVALIPKVKTPSQVSEFRPISLCNVVYKLASNVMANRLKGILPAVVSENQSAFVSGRQITDNALVALEIFHSMKHRFRGKRGHISMKLDMSKAYDRVEWSFLRALLLRLGFAGTWVQLIIECVSSVRYSFVVNGNVCGSVSPSRGLRQGDPLSPYLFILVADAFSAMLTKASLDKRIHGAKASRNGPEISHLLFADESLLFVRANRQECTTIVDILNKYECASGQKINIEKSEVTFSKGVCAGQKQDLIDILAMRHVDGHAKYLGVPTLAGRSKKTLFSEMKDRVWKKLQGWKEKLLSKAGKEVLLKAVIQAIPTYLMGVYRIPVGVLQGIHAAMARFWWGQQGTERKIHWKSWETLCQPKCCGGLGFRNLGVFNEALLGRQAWRLIQFPGSLLSRVMQAKYYPHSTFLESHLGPVGSYSWRSIWGAKSLVKEGILWRVGDGESIRVWQDPWVGKEASRFLATTPVAGVEFSRI